MARRRLNREAADRYSTAACPAHGTDFAEAVVPAGLRVGGCPVARNPGQTRFEVLIDHGGTPADPEDDEFLEFLGVVKESTGRTDDFCAAVVPELVG